MNSPPDPGSPISTDTSESPPPDDFQFAANNRDQQRILNVASAQLLNTSTTQTPTLSSKRRLPVGSSQEGPALRDAKSRRREDAASGSRRSAVDGQGQHGLVTGGPSGSTYYSRADYMSRRDKEELVDTALVEQLRKEFGDPFLDTSTQKH
ncbi:hypothetical protein ID866_4398 [Astraeus odoratus]|nr:hypothetical protein ID866_4398 [Astraeus odoratus]